MSSDEKPKVKQIHPDEVFSEGWKRAREIGHQTFHAGATVYSDSDGTPAGEMFLFFTINGEAAKAVRAVLEREGLLCDTDLGSIFKDEP